MQNSRRFFALLSLFIMLFVLPSVTSTASKSQEKLYVTLSEDWLWSRVNNEEMILSIFHQTISPEGAAYLRGRIAVYHELMALAGVNNGIVVTPPAEQP